MQVADDVLVVMAKYPVAGGVKTRLAKAIGDERACDLYRAFLIDLADRFRDAPWRLAWAVHPPGADLSSIVGSGARCFDQEGRNLAERMLRCFGRLFTQGARRVVMLGADAPHLPAARIADAFAALAQHDVAIVPTRDGGYCAIGLRASHDLFTPIEMSTPAVLTETMTLIASLGLAVRLLQESFDIDEPEDIDDLERLVETQDVSLPHTAAVLASWRR